MAEAGAEPWHRNAAHKQRSSAFRHATSNCIRFEPPLKENERLLYDENGRGAMNESATRLTGERAEAEVSSTYSTRR